MASTRRASLGFSAGSYIRYINPAGALLLGGGSPASYTGQPVHAAIGATAPHADGSPAVCELLLSQPHSEAIEAELVVLPFQERGKPAIQAIVRNITERKQIERTLREAKEAADAASRAKSQFLSTMSHELRTPLTAILGYAELLDRTLRDSASADALHDLGRIHSAGIHLLALINDVLDLSKIEAGRMQVQPTQVVLEPLVRDVIDTVQPLAERNGNRLELHGLDHVGTIVSDVLRLRQILVNLLGNACKFTHQGVVTLSVSVASESTTHGEQVCFAIHDTGIGISHDQLDRLFNDFVQIDASSTRRYGGTGLGLALSRRLARLLGGDITCVSQPGVGSIFTLILPRTSARSSATVPNAVKPVDSPAHTPLPAELDASPPENRLVLVIDDDPAVRDLLPRVLAHQQVHVETAAGGVEGLELATALLPDLIILDVLLPDLNGWDVLRQLKANTATQSIPVLMLTIEPDAEQGFMLGAASVLSKPLDRSVLIRELATVLRGRSTSRHLLLVSSDRVLRDALRPLCEADGWVVNEASDGPTALALIEREVPERAIIDLRIPGMDGVALIAALRSCSDGATLPILAVTTADASYEAQAQWNVTATQVFDTGRFRSDVLLENLRTFVLWSGDTQPQGGV